MIYDLILDVANGNEFNFSKRIFFANVDQDAELIQVIKSEEISELIKQMLKYSNNLAADSIAKTIAAEYFKNQGNFINVTKAFAEIIFNKARINPEKIKIIDGSGSSRYNLISAEQMLEILSYAYKNKNIFPYFIESLPTLGQSGTLENRFADYKNLDSKIFAKTGGMQGLNNLAGFIIKAKQPDLVFVIMINGHIGTKNILNKVIDQIVSEFNH